MNFTVYKIFRLGETDFHISGESGSATFHIGFALPKNNMFTETLNGVTVGLKFVQRFDFRIKENTVKNICCVLRESGLIGKYFRDEMDSVNKLASFRDSRDAIPLTVDTLQGGFLLWAIVLMISILIFIAEVIMF